jgi:hypothetical protein
MTYTINQAVDVNASVDIGNIQLNENTISSTDTNGNILLSPNGTGNVGIGTTSPSAMLDIGGNTDGSVQAILTRGSDTDFQLQAINESSSNNSGAVVSKFGLRHGTNETALFNFIRGNAGNDGSIAIITNNSESMRVNSVGNVGIGTTAPKAKLHIDGAGDSGTSLASASRTWIHSFNSSLNHNTTTASFGGMSIYASGEIVASGAILSHGTTSYSDARIKKNIVDINDDSALQTIRSIKPKKYSYVDTIAKGTAPVWGFIAQEVAETVDYAVEKMQKAIPSVYKLASVSQDGFVLTFDEPVSLELGKLQLNTITSEEYEVELSEIISSTIVRLSEPLKEEQHTGIINGESINGKVFVYGQVISDFHVLKKDAIFTVAVAALQEVDRRQTTDNERILELETENALQEERVAKLEAQVAALLQHTGVSV